MTLREIYTYISSGKLQKFCRHNFYGIIYRLVISKVDLTENAGICH